MDKKCMRSWGVSNDDATLSWAISGCVENQLGL